MDIKNPEYIVEIARQQGVTRAAEKLFLTQSTLSQYLLKLEAELGTPLFRREQNRLFPTGAGRIYIQAAQDILRIQEAAREGIDALRGQSHIDLGVTSAWGLELLTDILPAFKQRFPAVTLRLEENRNYLEMQAILRAGRVDLAVMAVPPEEDVPAQGYTHLRWEEIVLVLPEGHPFCAAHGKEAAVDEAALSGELRGESFLLSGKNASIRRMQEALFARLMYHPAVVCELNDNAAALRMTAAGIGVLLCPRSYADRAQGVRSFRLNPPLLREDVLVYRRRIQKTEPLACLEELIVGNARFRAEGAPLPAK